MDTNVHVLKMQEERLLVLCIVFSLQQLYRLKKLKYVRILLLINNNFYYSHCLWHNSKRGKNTDEADIIDFSLPYLKSKYEHIFVFIEIINFHIYKVIKKTHSSMQDILCILDGNESSTQIIKNLASSR